MGKDTISFSYIQNISDLFSFAAQFSLYSRPIGMCHIAREDEPAAARAGAGLQPLPCITNHEKRHKARDGLCAFIYINMCKRLLELCCLGRAWEWDDIADVLHACYEEDQTLESESEASVRA